jgi:CRISPR/Cas system endoribonuclease Cas6 (RAMP superfamily)
MTLGGVLGRWTLHGTPEVLAEIYPWLWLGQWLHVGKNASMGLGGYQLESGPTAATGSSGNTSANN